MRSRVGFGVGFAAVLFLSIQLGALALLPSFYSEGYQAVEDPTNPTNSLVYVGVILIVTLSMLAAMKFDLDRLIRGVITTAAAGTTFYVFSVFVTWPLALIGSVTLGVGLWVYPEWYVIDSIGVIMGAGASGIFGISFGLLPALVLLVVLAVYDAISVYGTEHMLDLADGVLQLRLPVLFVIPTTLSYSFLEDTQSKLRSQDDDDALDRESMPDQTHTEDGIRDVFFIGLGDAVIPTILIASAAFFLPSELAPSLGVPGIPAMTIPALSAMIGTFVGFFILQWMVLQGRAHAGLPLLNGGAISGYLIGTLATGIPLLRAVGL
jgi:presenilin-like A22 family membrane protease